MRSILLLTPLLLLACREKGGDDTSGGTPGDEDGDGYEAALDCNDADASIHPDATEICDEVDNNCDESIDEGVTVTFYGDGDADGYGLLDVTTEACQVPEGHSANGADCDDTNDAIHPDAPELCDSLDNDCDGTPDDDVVDPLTWYADSDQDSFGDAGTTTLSCAQPAGDWVDNGEDCDDGLDTVNPLAAEVCDEMDNDCDGLTDDADDVLTGGIVFYDDADDDGYGDPAITLLACEEPKGASDNDNDCDDTNPDVNPLADEVCDLIDNDCDAMVDADDADFEGGNNFWVDGDGDGFGAPGAPVEDCLAPTGYVDNNDDCDDADAKIGEPDQYYTDSDLDGYGSGALMDQCEPGPEHVLIDGDCRPMDADTYPGATEVCDGTDNNCDGLTDDDDPLVVLSSWYADADGDGYGVDTDTYDSCEDAITGYVGLSGDCDDADTSAFPGAPEYCDSIDNDCDGTTDNDLVYVDWYGDTDLDGYGDDADVQNDCTQPSGYELLGGDCDDDSDLVNPSAYETCNDDTDNDCDGFMDNCEVDVSSAVFTFEGATTNDYIGASVTTGDLDDDGTPDLVVGGTSADATGQAFIMFGPSTGVTSADDADVIVTSAAAGFGAAFGSSLAAGDEDSDGAADLLVGASGDDVTYLFLGPVTADVDSASADATLSTSTFSSVGMSVALLSDVSDDALPDIAFGAPYADGYQGTVYVVTGPTTGATTLDTSAEWIYEGVEAYGYLGTDVIDLGDMDGDGLSDLAMGSPYGGGYYGSVYVVPGGDAPGTYDVDVVAAASITGAEVYDYLGTSVTALDWDGDGTPDLATGATSADGATVNNVGVVYLFLGPVSGALVATDAEVIFEGGRASGAFGNALAGGGDIDGDLNQDLAVHASYGTGTSALEYVFRGPDTGTFDASAAIQIGGMSGWTYTGSLAWLGDWDGDGNDEVVVGSSGSESSAGDNYAGVAYVVGSSGL